MASEEEEYEAPNLLCRDCAFCETELCRRVNYRTLDFRHNPFGGALAGHEHTMICRDFKMRSILVYDLAHWPGFDVWQEAWIKQWLHGREPKYVWFHVNGIERVDYGVPYRKFVDGTHIDGDTLLAVVRQYHIRCREGLGYKLITEPIDGVKFGGRGEFTFFPRKYIP